MSKRTRTPCVGICSTTYGDDVCRGCKRFVKEVINWNSFNPEEREAVWKRLEKLKTQIMRSRVIVVDEEMLLKKIKEYRLRIHEDLNNYCKVFELIKQASKSFSNLEEFGVKTKRNSINLEMLKDETEKELYELSLAHYSRYFVEPVKYKEIDIK
jgi:hypothetical protein